jgi:hypothetical protein
MVDRAIDTEEEPAAVGELELVAPEPAAPPRGGPRWRLAGGLIVHGGLLSCHSMSERSAVRSARQVALGRSSDEGADPRGQLTLVEGIALPVLDPAAAASAPPERSRPAARPGQ